MKSLMGSSSGGNNELQGLANTYANGDYDVLVNTINDFFVSMSGDVPRLQSSHPIFDISEPLPDAFIIRVEDTEAALRNVKTNKSSGPDNIPSWILKEFAHILAAPVTAIFNSSLREGVLPKVATIIPLPKKRPLASVDNDIRPIALTPIIAKVFESLVLKGNNTNVTQLIIEKNNVYSNLVSNQLLYIQLHRKNKNN